MTDTARVEGLFTYPVKGLSAQSHESVTLVAGEGFPGDRLFGFARAGSGFDPENPQPMPKNKFLVLAQEAALAKLETSFDAGSGRLKITHGGERLAFDVSDDAGRKEAAEFLKQHLDLGDGKTPSLVHAAPHRFTDVSVVSPRMMHAVSVLNLESLRAFEREIGARIEPARFRANLVLDGWPAFSELEMMEQEFTVGEARLKVIFHTRRCAATQVNPGTADRDIDIPRLLHQHYGHMNMGVYAEVLTGGAVTIGAPISL